MPDDGQPQIPDEATRVAQAAAVEEWNKGSAETVQMLAALRAGLAAAYPVLAAQWQAEVERLRARIHEAVDECQRRHARYVARCVDFDRWSTWARQRFEEAGDPVNGYDYWQMTSEANRLVIMSILAERDAGRAEVERLRNLLGQTTAALNVALHHDPTSSRPEAPDEVGGCREALRDAVAELHPEVSR